MYFRNLKQVFRFSESKLGSSLIKKEEILYGSDPKMKGYLAYDSSLEQKAPGIIVVHEWWGHDNYCRRRAVQLAEMGYVALALDMYGDGKTACHPKEAKEYMMETLKNYDIAAGRFLKALETLKKQPQTDETRIGAIGYCYGGGIVLNMAASGADLKGVVSFHGTLVTHVKPQKGACKAKILVCNGESDPLITAEQIKNFKELYTAAGIDYKFINYPGAKHAFTNPEATEKGKKFGMPLEYNEAADKQSWAELTTFFKDVFPK